MFGGQKFLRAINGTSGGPVNTLNSQNRPAERRTSAGPTPAETASSSPYFLPPDLTQDPTHSSLRDDIFDLRSTSSPRDDVSDLRSTSSANTVAGHSQNVPEFRSAQPKSACQKRVRRKSRTASIPLVSTPKKLDSSPGRVGRRTLVESPDALASDQPPPASVVSDISSSKKQRPQRSDMTMPPIKNYQPQAAVETICDSDDELSHEPNSNGKRPNNFSQIRQPQRPATARGDIQSTSFGITRRPADPPPMLVKSAACGKESYESDNQQHRQILLRLDPTGLSGLVPMRASGERATLEWLHINVRKCHVLQLAEGKSPCVVIHRSKEGPNDAKLYLKFTRNQDVSALVNILSSARNEPKPPDELEAMMQHAVRLASQYRSKMSTMQPKGAEGSQAPWTTTSPSRAAKKENGSRPERIVDRLRGPTRSSDLQSVALAGPSDIQSIALAGQWDVPSTSTCTQTRRTRRSSPPLVARQPSPVLWTKQNQDWKNSWHRSLVYPATGRNRATVDAGDIVRLDEGEFLNDNLISFYLRYLQVKLEREQPEFLKKVYIFSTFFFEKLRSTRGKINYEGVKAWTTKFDLFSYDYVIVPVNEHAHWYLAIICNVPNALGGITAGADDDVMDATQDSPRPNAPGLLLKRAANATQPMPIKNDCRTPSSGGSQKVDYRQPKIVTLDSLGSQHSATCKALKEYLVEEAKEKKGLGLAVIPSGLTAKGIPQQDNFCDCGVFVLGYVEEFLKDPDGVARKLVQKESLEWDMRAPSLLRDSIRTLLFDLQEEQRLRLEQEKEERKEKAAEKDRSRNPQLAGLAAQALAKAKPARDAGNGTAQGRPGGSGLESARQQAGDASTLAGRLESDSSASTTVPNEAFFSAQSSPDEELPKVGAVLESNENETTDDRRSEPRFVTKLPSSPEPGRLGTESCQYDGIDPSVG